MCGLDDFFADAIGQGPQQRYALGGSDGQVKSVHAAVGEGPLARRFGGDPVIEPPRRGLGVSEPASQGGPSRPMRSLTPAASPTTSHVGTRVSPSV